MADSSPTASRTLAAIHCQPRCCQVLPVCWLSCGFVTLLPQSFPSVVGPKLTVFLESADICSLLCPLKAEGDVVPASCPWQSEPGCEAVTMSQGATPVMVVLIAILVGLRSLDEQSSLLGASEHFQRANQGGRATLSMGSAIP